MMPSSIPPRDEERVEATVRPLPPLPYRKKTHLSPEGPSASSLFPIATPSLSASPMPSETSSFPTNAYKPFRNIPYNASTGIAQRHVASTGQANPSSFAYGVGGDSSSMKATSYVLPPTSYAPPRSTSVSTTSANGDHLQYKHNTAAVSFLLPSMASILWWHESTFTIKLLLSIGLVLYGIDLANGRDSLVVSVWISALIMTMGSGFAVLLQVDDSDAAGSAMILHLLQLAVEGMLFCAMACWITLQLNWLHRDIPSVAVGLEKTLHSLIPPVSASILSFHISRFLMDYWGMDFVATLWPHLFAGLMSLGMVLCGCKSSFQKDCAEEQAHVVFSIASFGARTHSMLLLLMPGVMHLFIFRHRIMSRHASTNDLFDLVLVLVGPYLCHCGILRVHNGISPYQMSNGLFPNPLENSLRGALLPIVTSFIASFAAQQRYLIPICNKISYQFNGHNLPPTWILSLYLTNCTCFMLFAMWTWGRKSSVTGELLFGEYHEDAVQLAVSGCGLFLGKALGFPWNLTPLPILAFLGLSVWITTRMLRYLGIFLFVVHAAGVVLFNYRFAAIKTTIPLALPGINVGLVRLGTIEVTMSILIGIVAGFAVRPAGGVGASFLRVVDIPGIILVIYIGALVVMEATLLKTQLPEDLVGKELDMGVEDAGYLYDHGSALLTSFALLIITTLSYRFKITSAKATMIAFSLSIGKALAVFIDANEADGKLRSKAKQELTAHKIVGTTIAAAGLLFIVMAPRVVLTPIHIKSSSRYKRSLADGKPVGATPARAVSSIFIYCVFVLPAALIASIPKVLTPLAIALSSHYGAGAYYKSSPPLSEMIGFALCIWATTSLSMISFYLPDGGAETWRKAAAITLLMGFCIALSAPSIPGWFIEDSGIGVSNPYTRISSAGATLVIQDRSRTGGWGILSASLATLLAITGPLELRERRHPSGRKDQYLLLRLMIFSVLFGSGVSWFITIQSMSETKFFVLVITGLACMVVSFFATVTCVLGYFLELENFEDVNQMASIWIVAFSIFGFVTGMPVFFQGDEKVQAFGAGGWLSTYLTISSLACSALSVALRMRPAKNHATRGLANSSCLFSYALAIFVLYGRFGVIGIDYASGLSLYLGIPTSVVGTVLIAPLLLTLEGESTKERRSRVSRISASKTSSSTGKIGLNMKSLTHSNRFAPLIAATYLSFTMAGFYAIFLHGAPFFQAPEETYGKLSSELAGKKELSLVQLVQRSAVSVNAISTRVATSSFWTASSPLGPIIHAVGLFATIPSVVMLLSNMWTGVKVPKSQVTLGLLLNFIPLLFSRGIPFIPAAALVGVVGGILQVLDLQRSDRRSQMRI